MKYSCLLIIVLLYSCIQNTKEESVKHKVINVTKEIKQDKVYSDTITIDYSKHKTLLTVLKQLPETTMDSWEWSKKEREKTVKFIENNNYLIDSTEMYHNIKYIKPNTIGIQVIDGFWTLSIYQFSENNYFIVTNDIVGGGNDVQTFNYINNKIIPLKMINWFGGSGYRLLKNNGNQDCNQLIDDNLFSFSYDFSQENNIKISSWLTKNEAEECLKGNTIKYILNKENRTFDIEDMYWEKGKGY